MAKNQLKSNNGHKARRTGGPLSFIFDRRFHLALGITLIVAAVVVAATSISYLKTGVEDQSLVESSTVKQMAESGAEVQNVGGPFGAKLAHLLLVDTLGAASFISVIWLGVLGLSLVGAMRCRFWSFTFKCLLTAVGLSVILGLVTYGMDSTINWGGNHGRYVNAWLMSVGGWLIALAVTVVIAAILIAIYYYPILRGMGFAGGWITKAREHRRLQREEIEERNREALKRQASQGPVVVNFENENSDAKPEVKKDEPKADNHDQKKVETDDKKDEGEKTDTLADDGFVVTSNEIEQDKELAKNPDKPVTGSLDTLYDHRAELSHYVFPSVDILLPAQEAPQLDMNEQKENKDLIVKTLLDYKIAISRIEATVGPTVTRYEIVPAEGVRIAQIKRLEDDIALSLAALGIRIIAPIPGKGTIGIEVPNRDPRAVAIRTVLSSKKFVESDMALPMAMGATISNEIFVADLAKMPHLLVAGATGQGKSVGLNCIIASLLYKKHPSELKFVLIDPKMVEFSLYKRLEKHYLAKLPNEDDAIITDPSKAVATLNSLCQEMDNRYALLSKANVRSLEEYNRKFSERRLNPENGHRYMPYIVMIVDEFADLIMTAGRDISAPIARIAQKARAVGMHMIIATQRPSTDVITGMIKANFPGRIAFRVAQRIDSMTILDHPGANQLIGRGDMLFSHNSKVERVQCAYIDTKDVEAIIEHIDNQQGFLSAYELPEPHVESAEGGMLSADQRDEKFAECARFVVQQPTASTSSLQRRFGIGYNKAGKIMDQMQAAGIVGPADGAKPRAVLVDPETLERILSNS